ncbi:TPA: Arc family DNA-binding protein [Yersinia enterocolitica]|nr:Arc family DNA-binding protein [Yersinia enterocolitica]HEN3525476.1 Arc family DNA-binding protein [Yersinia enterocolitica]
MTEKQVKDYEKFVVRFPDGMRDAIAEKAKASGRSMNSEIITAIEAWLSGEQAEDLSEKSVDRVIRIATKAFAEEISRNYDLVPKVKGK